MEAIYFFFMIRSKLEFLSLTMSKRHSDDRDDSDSKRRRAGITKPPMLYDIFHGEVASVKDYGVFVRIPDCDQQGLVHITQMSVGKISHPNEMAEVRDRVWCKIISIDSGDGKIGLSMKLVNQGSGKDLDQNNVQLKQDEQKRRQGPDNKFQKITLEAEYNTTCRKCGGKGHLAQDCFGTGDKTYDLVPDIDDLVDKEMSEKQLEKKSKKSKKEKKEKKEKKHKHKHKHKQKKDDR